MPTSVAIRGLAFFGFEGDEVKAQTVKLGRQSCAIVSGRGMDGDGGKALAIYDESRYPPRGYYRWMSAKEKAALIAALGGGSNDA